MVQNNVQLHPHLTFYADSSEGLLVLMGPIGLEAGLFSELLSFCMPVGTLSLPLRSLTDWSVLSGLSIGFGSAISDSSFSVATCCESLTDFTDYFEDFSDVLDFSDFSDSSESFESLDFDDSAESADFSGLFDLFDDLLDLIDSFSSCGKASGSFGDGACSGPWF